MSAAAVKADDDVVAASKVHDLEQRVRGLERLLGRQTMEVDARTTYGSPRITALLNRARPKRAG